MQELARRDWRGKRWTTRKGVVRGGKPFHKASLHYLLTNVTYVGRVRYQDEIYEGNHEAIVAEDVFQRVQDLLARNRRSRRQRRQANGRRGLLEGLLYCAACQSLMSHTYTTKGSRRYRYYVCASAQKRGFETCPAKSVPAAEIERFVLGEIDEDPHARSTSEQAQLIAQRVNRVDYHAAEGDLYIRLAAAGESA